MRRDHYKVFSEGKIGPRALPNRLVRSATADPSLFPSQEMNEEVLDLYRAVAAGGVGLIITGDFPALPEGLWDEAVSHKSGSPYEQVKVKRIGELAEAVHTTAPQCGIVAQISAQYRGVAPSDIPSPFTGKRPTPLSKSQIRQLVECCVDIIRDLKDEGFDGVQFHAAHGGLLSRFLSPYTNRREDEYGGSAENRARVFREILSEARPHVGQFPILIKMNCTDYMEGGTDLANFPELALEIERCGIDAIEISGGMWDCLVRTKEELGFRPVPAPESHTGIEDPAKQSYFLKYAETLSLDIPVILVGGNRDVERLEGIVRQGKVDFVAMCRPLINEPDLPKRWVKGQGSSGTDCISCNSCIFDMWDHINRGKPWIATCSLKHDSARVRAAQEWLSAWEKKWSGAAP
jgi:2,4-dienoyl-CoA reductase-like NADH-dependent reductase (Old Yellow Enzyme family)